MDHLIDEAPPLAAKAEPNPAERDGMPELKGFGETHEDGACFGTVMGVGLVGGLVAAGAAVLGWI